jgi:hypothetical protein
MLLGLILLIFGYCVTGAFICGLADEEEFYGLWLFLWPIMLVILLIARAAEFATDVGCNVRDHFQSYFEKE